MRIANDGQSDGRFVDEPTVGDHTTLPLPTLRPTPHQRTFQVKQMLLLVAIAAVIAPVMTATTKDRLGDLQAYKKAAGRLAQNEQFYRPDERQAFTYPPFFALPFVPFVGLSEPATRTIWYFLNILMLGAVIAIVWRRIAPVIQTDYWQSNFGGDRSSETQQKRFAPPTWMFLAVVGLLSARFVMSPIEYQGHDLVVFLCVLLGVASWDRKWSPGIWIGLATACKATPLLFLPVLIVQRRTAAVFGFLIAMVGATLLPDLLFPNAEGGLWVTSWYEKFISKVGVGRAADAAGAWASWNYLNQSLAGTLFRLTTHITENSTYVFDISLWRLEPATTKLVTAAAQLAVVAIVAFLAWPTHSRGLPPSELRFHRLGQAAAVMCGMLLLSPMTSKQHFCTLLIPITFCVTDFCYRRRSWQVAVGVVAVCLLGTIGAKDLIGRPIGNMMLAYGALTFCTVACLLTTGYVLVSRSRAVRRSLHWEQPERLSLRYPTRPAIESLRAAA